MIILWVNPWLIATLVVWPLLPHISFNFHNQSMIDYPPHFTETWRYSVTFLCPMSGRARYLKSVRTLSTR